jgi:hypothetical protein
VDAEGTNYGSGGLATYLHGRLLAWEQKALAQKAESAVQLALKAPQTALDSETSARLAEVNIERQRINLLVATPNGSFYEKSSNGVTGALLVVSSGATAGQINLADVTPAATGYTPAVSDYVRLVYGVSSGTAELQDLHVGADDITYASAGDAIRGQVGKLNEDLAN